MDETDNIPSRIMRNVLWSVPDKSIKLDEVPQIIPVSVVVKTNLKTQLEWLLMRCSAVSHINLRMK